MNTTLTETPQEIVGLTVATKYLFQNQGNFDIYLHEGPTLPTADEQDFFIIPGRGVGKIGEADFTLGTGMSLYGWVSDGEAKIFFNMYG